MGQRFFLDRDNSSHWYIVPADRRAEWNAWRNIPEDDDRGWIVPDWVIPLNTHPNQVTFESFDFNQT